MVGGKDKCSRRQFLGKSLTGLGFLNLNPMGILNMAINTQFQNTTSTVYRTMNGTPSDNLRKTIELFGGITSLVGTDDVVMIKPNVQWWNQGSVNLAILEALVNLIMEMKEGFKGEVIVAENCHRGPNPWASKNSGWANTFQWNSDIPEVRNMLELTLKLKTKYGDHFSVVHFINVDAGGKRTYGPEQGTGYVYCDGNEGTPALFLSNGLHGSGHRQTMATYPVFRTDNGTIVDFKNGIWEKGSYTEQPVKLINLAGLNHHSSYCGMTSCIKNYMGIVDLSGGPDPNNKGHIITDTYNFHSFPFDKWAKGPVPGMLGAEIAFFMDAVRKADLNIVTAEWVGLASRVDPPMARTRCVLASTDPVALDYHSSKYILYPNSKIWFHNPDLETSPVRGYLERASTEGAGTFDERSVDVVSFDLGKEILQENGKSPVHGEFVLGTSPKSILKYLLYRFSPV